MALLTVEGLYEDGKVALVEKPEGVQRGRVMVTFLTAEPVVVEQEEMEEQRRLEARKRLLASMKRGLDFGGEKFNREEIYAERLDQLDQRRR